MPTTVSELNQSLVYTWCPLCRQSGNDRSPLTRDMHVIRCALGHSFSGAQLTAMGADMVKANEIFHETPAITDIMWKLPVNPAVKAAIEEKFAGRIFVTIGTLLAALADGSLVMITGEQATKLKKHGINNGGDMVALAESVKELEREKQEAITAIEKFQLVLRAAGVPGA